MAAIADMISEVLHDIKSMDTTAKVRQRVRELTARFPLPYERASPVKTGTSSWSAVLCGVWLWATPTAKERSVPYLLAPTTALICPRHGNRVECGEPRLACKRR